MAESLFFPEGKLKNLKLESLTREMCDIQQNVIDAKCTVDELYEKTKVKHLRVYLCTKKSKVTCDTDSNLLILPSVATQTIQVYLLDEEWNSTNENKPEKIQSTTDLEKSFSGNQPEDTSGETTQPTIVDLVNIPSADKHDTSGEVISQCFYK